MANKYGLHRRKDGVYEKSIRDSNGKRVYFYSRDPEEVMRQYFTYDEKKKRGVTFKEAADEWWEIKEPRLKLSTRRSYELYYEMAVEAFGDIGLNEIAAKHITKELATYTNKHTNGTYLKKRTISNYLCVIRGILKYAVSSGYIEYNVALAAELPDCAKTTPRRYPTSAEIDVIEANIDAPFGFFYYFALYSGLRRGEACALLWGDIDFDEGVIHVTKELAWKSNVPIVDKPKTAAAVRDVVLLDNLKKELYNRKQSRAKEIRAEDRANKVKPRDINKQPIFTKDGSYLLSSQWQDLTEAYKKRTGIDLTPHEMRHGFATLCFSADVDVKTTQYLLGHAQLTTTLGIYTHLADELKKKSIGKLNEFIANGRCYENTEKSTTQK